MSVLLIGAEDELVAAVIGRLVDEGDEVRVVAEDDARAARWRELGAFVARGAPDDFDLVERAAQNVRTVVVLGDGVEMEPVLRGAAAAGVGRIVTCGSADPAGALAESGLDYVVLDVPAAPLWRRGRRLRAETLAEAIDAADDLAGNPRLILDLGTDDAWSALGVATPKER